MEVSTGYPTVYERLQERMAQLGEAAESPMAGFQQLHDAATADGALSRKTKELIALAIGISVRCDGCIAYHVHDSLEAGASREEVAEAVGVAIMMGGGPSVVYGAEAIAAVDQFGEEANPPGQFT
jgi:AhpD family alkylhydroperoxidase